MFLCVAKLCAVSTSVLAPGREYMDFLGLLTSLNNVGQEKKDRWGLSNIKRSLCLQYTD